MLLLTIGLAAVTAAAAAPLSESKQNSGPRRITSPSSRTPPLPQPPRLPGAWPKVFIISSHVPTTFVSSRLYDLLTSLRSLSPGVKHPVTA